MMSQRFGNIRNIKWVVGDVRHMIDITDELIDVAIDKGTLYAMISGSLWDLPGIVKVNVKKYIDEVNIKPSYHHE